MNLDNLNVEDEGPRATPAASPDPEAWSVTDDVSHGGIEEEDDTTNEDREAIIAMKKEELDSVARLCKALHQKARKDEYNRQEVGPMPDYWPHTSTIAVRNLDVASLEETQVTAIFKPMDRGSIQIKVDQIEILIAKTTNTPPIRSDGGCLQGKKSTRGEWGFVATNAQVQTWFINSKRRRTYSSTSPAQ